jgi:hypothetical protein
MASFVFTGNILGEATDLLGNNLLEAMRQSTPLSRCRKICGRTSAAR